MSKEIKKLTIQQAVEGKNKALQNARELLEESQILLTQGKYARAYFLSAIAIEELGKHIMLVSLAIRIVLGNVNWNNFWKRFRDHKSKTLTFLHTENTALSKDRILFPPDFIDNGATSLEEYKLQTLYSDMKNERFVCPNDIVNESLAKKVVDLAEKRLKYFTLQDLNFAPDDMFYKLDKELVISILKKTDHENLINNH